MIDDLKVSFVVPGYKCDEFIFRNIDSILDQDYLNYEIVSVLNGVWDTKEQLKQGIRDKYGDKVKIVSIPEGGLGNANNVGFTSTTGDIISHLSSDLYLVPGALRNWVEAFQDNPDVGMVYSGYRFVSPNMTDVFESNPFNRYHLECENFIDGANPVRRKDWQRWNTELKSLIDWDWALSVTDNGIKAHYIKEPMYYAEFPKPGGLSYDSNDYWVERCKQVRKLHNIPWRDMCIASLTDQPYALKLAELLGIDFKRHPGFKPHEYRLIYLWEYDCRDMNIQHNTSFFLNHFGHKAVHWTGEDIRGLCDLRWIDVDLYVQTMLKHVETHYCLTKEDQKVLGRMGINAEVIFPPMDIPEEPTERKVGISVNNEGIRDQLRKAMPDMKFYINDLSCPITVHFKDRFESIIRSVCMGNKVITNSDVKGTLRVQGFTNVPELRKMLVHLIRQAVRKDMVDRDLINDYRIKTNPKNFYNRLRKIADKKIHKYGRLEEIEANA